MFISKLFSVLVSLSVAFSAHAKTHYFDFDNPAVYPLFDRALDKNYFKLGLNNKDLTDAECLTYVLYGEARGEGDDGILAVAYVVENRKNKWHMDYCQVIRSPGEFLFHVSGLHGQDEEDTWLHILNLSYFLINERGYDTLESPVANALYFNSLQPEQQGVMGKGRFIRKIGHHYFYK